MKIPTLRLCVSAVSLLLLSGCLPILIHASVEAEAQEKTAYSAYCDTQAKINSDRQIAGLSTNAVLSRSEWKRTVQRRP